MTHPSNDPTGAPEPEPEPSFTRPLWRHYLAALGVQAEHLSQDPNPPADLEIAMEANVRHVADTIARLEGLNTEAGALRALWETGPWTDADNARMLEVLAGLAQLQADTRAAMAELLVVAARYQKPPGGLDGGHGAR